MILRRSFRAMGTDCEWMVDADHPADAISAFAAVERDVMRREAEWSRFLADSDLSRLNRNGVVNASRELIDLVGQALELRDETGGLFDPTVHDAVVAAGYDRSFDAMPADVPTTALSSPSGGGEVTLDVETGVIRLAPGVRLDLGGIAKGYAADRAADVLSVAGPCVANLGGEVAVRGRAWPIGVEAAAGVIVIDVEQATVATSGIDRRRWLCGDRDRHHVIDPRTGESVPTDLLRVTVVDTDGARADALATALLVAGRERALEMVEHLGVAAILQAPDGVIDTRKVLR